MRELTSAIVREPPATISEGITSADLGEPDYEKARGQHERYVRALEECGLEVMVLEADDTSPDSVFVEDTAIVTDRCAVVANPGAASRRREVIDVREELFEIFGDDVESITLPGTLDGGDILQVEDHFYIGLTGRTNRKGAEQLSAILSRYGFGASFVDVRRFLHLKTGVSYLGDGVLVVAGELAEYESFERFDKVFVPPEEEYGANCVRVNDRVLMPGGCPRTKEKLVGRGYEVNEVETSEFRKMDGGVSCLSLRF